MNRYEALVAYVALCLFAKADPFMYLSAAPVFYFCLWLVDRSNGQEEARDWSRILIAASLVGLAILKAY